MAQSYKTLKEDFVSNLSGGQMSEINYVTAVAPVKSLPLLEGLIINLSLKRQLFSSGLLFSHVKISLIPMGRWLFSRIFYSIFVQSY